MSKENGWDGKVLDDFTLKTLKELVATAGGALSGEAIDRIQRACFSAANDLDTYPDSIQGIRKMINLYNSLSPKDRAIIAESIEDAYADGLKREIKHLQEHYQKQICKITGGEVDWEQVEAAHEQREALKKEMDDVFFEKFNGYKITLENKFIHALEGQDLQNLPPTKGKKPPCELKFVRDRLMESLYLIYEEDIKLQPVDTKNGHFECFLKEIFAHPAMEVFDVKDMHKAIGKTRACHQLSLPI